MEEQKKEYYYGDYVEIDDDMRCDYLKKGNIFFVKDINGGRQHLYMIANEKFLNNLRVQFIIRRNRPESYVPAC